VNRVAVGDDHVLEGKLEQRAQRREYPLVVPRCRPHEQLTFGRGRRVREDERSLLGQPEWRLVSVPAVVERDEATGKLDAGPDRGLDESPTHVVNG
jgi:hypothetical protein